LTRTEQVFDTWLMTLTELEIARRSLVAGSLTPERQSELIEECQRLLTREAKIDRALTKLQAPFGDVRACLNDLRRILHE
jgi:hypothetical protein